MYSFETDRGKKVFYLKAGGSFTPEEAQRFIQDYQKNLSSFNAKEYYLLGDGGELKASTREMLNELKGIFQLYLNSGFKMVIIHDLHASTKMQIVKLIKEINSDRLKISETKDSALKELGL